MNGNYCTTEILLNIDDIPFLEKPRAKEDVPGIRKRLSKGKRIIKPEGLIECIERGCSFTPAAMSGMTGDSWLSQQALITDVDNDRPAIDDNGNPIKGKKVPVDKPLSGDDALNILHEYGIRPSFMYHTFSNSDELEKFRIVFITDNPVETAAEAVDLTDRITNVLNAASPGAVDTTMADPARLIYGSTKGSVFYDSKSLVSLDALRALPKGMKSLMSANQSDAIVSDTDDFIMPTNTGLEFIQLTQKCVWFQDWASKHSVIILRTVEKNDGTMIYGVICPWEDQHSEDTGDLQSAVIIRPNGVIQYVCQHAHCHDKSWKEYRAFYEKNSDLLDVVNYDEFLMHNNVGKPTGVFDDKIFNHIKQRENILIIGGIPWIEKNGNYVPDLNGSRLKTMIRELIEPHYIKATTIKRIYDLFISDYELQTRPEDTNLQPASWINFRNGFYDPISKRMITHSPEYKTTNQIPHEYDPNREFPIEEYRTIEKWINSISDNADDIEMMLQYNGLCMTTDTRQQKMLILLGRAGSGKSTLIRMNEYAIGTENISNISLSQLQHRFAAFGLLGKLLNSCADLEITALEDTATIKKLLGEDMISAEAKGKDAISFRSKARMIFSTNELPNVRNEKSAGFYRRVLILKMDKVPEKSEADYFDELSKHIDLYIHMCVEALERMYEEGHIFESELSKSAVKQMRNDSDSIEAFLSEWAERDPSERTTRKDLYDAYVSYCISEERQAHKKTRFYAAMRTKGFRDMRSSGIDYFEGIKLDQKALSFSPKRSVPYWQEAQDVDIAF